MSFLTKHHERSPCGMLKTLLTTFAKIPFKINSDFPYLLVPTLSKKSIDKPLKKR